MQLGASIAVGDLGAGPAAMRDYAQTAEGLGFDYLVAPDHVLGTDPAKIAAGQRGSNATAYHDPFVLFGFLAGVTKKIGFAAGVLILAQRQAALVAKQAASLDALCEGRFRLGVGVGWNEVEFQGLGMDFHTRGVRSAEQVRFMQALWAKEGVTFNGKYHELTDGGINPRPKSGKVEVWFGGHAEQTLTRVAKYGDGFMPNRWPPGDEVLKIFDRLRDDQSRGPQAGRCRPRGLDVAWQGHARRLAQGSRVLEEGGLHARARTHDLHQRDPRAHQREDIR